MIVRYDVSGKAAWSTKRSKSNFRFSLCDTVFASGCRMIVPTYCGRSSPSFYTSPLTTLCDHMLRWFFDAKDASPLEILSVVPMETFAGPGEEVAQTPEYTPDKSDGTAEGDAVLRWRRVVLHLSDEFSRAAQRHPHLAPIFMEAMGNLLEQLLLFGREEDVEALDEWLHFRPPSR